MRLGSSPWRACPCDPQSTTRTTPYDRDLIRREMLMLHVSSCVQCLEILTFQCVDNKRASPFRDAIAKDLVSRHTKRVSFGQGPMTSVRVELWGSRTLNCRYWAGLLHRPLLSHLSFF